MPREYASAGPWTLRYDVDSNPQVVVPVAGWDKANFTVESDATTGALQFLGGATRGGPFAAIGSGYTVTGPGTTGPIDCRGYAYIGVGCSTTQTGKVAQISAFLAVTGD